MFVTRNQQGYINTWISMNYCKKWDIWEGLREILQNQMDGITSAIGKINIDPIPFGPVQNNIKYQFQFKHKDTNDIYGEILYNEINNTLTVWNKGKLETGDLLLGGIKDVENKDEIIGRFGEGMKLAALAFVRKNKRFSIITDRKIWTFIQQKDNNFIKNGQPQACLHWKGENCNIEKYLDKVTIEVSPLTLDEWIPYIDNFLWLTQRYIGKIDAKDSNGKPAQLLYNKFFRNKIYVKDIFVQKTEENNGATTCFFGYNTDLELDRDRNAVKNLDQRNKQFSAILADVMNRRNQDEVLNNLEGEERLLFQENYPKEIMFLSENSFYTSVYINNYLTTESRNALWNTKVAEKLEERRGKNIVYSPYQGYLHQFLREKKLPESFYPYFLIGSSWFWGILTKSSYYKHYETLYNEKIINSPEVNEPHNLGDVINEITNIVKTVDANFKRENIKFRNFGDEFNDEIVYFNNNIIYFSNKLGNINVDRIKKFWMLETVCHFFKINAIRLLINSSPFFR